ncbi:MAG: hypothetical protein C4576_13810 [Desulfobacteraceae bacterium]|nr:MAG: hypothetical protein C4576_13810 [Desulfobacteraceae bacterium]
MSNENRINNRFTFEMVAEAFFNMMFSKVLEEGLGQIELRTFPKGRAPSQSFYSDIKKAVKDTYDICQSGIDVYFGVNPRTGGAGKKENVHYLTSFHAEVDYGKDGHKKAPGHATREEALEAIKAFEPKPTIVNHSGGGFHCYWVLNSPLKVADVGVEKLESINRALSDKLGGDRGTQNLDRVLRVPGTYNFKLTDNPRKVDLVWNDGPQCDQSEFEFLVDAGKDIKVPNPDPKESSTMNSPSVSNKIQVSDKVKKLIRNGNDGTYPSRSEADMAVVSELVRKGGDFENIKKVFQKYPIGQKYRQHASPDQYLKHTIETAKKFSNLTEEELANPLFTSESIRKVNDKEALDPVKFQEYMARKYKLRYYTADTSFFRYNGQCYEPIDYDGINNLCQTELGQYRYLLKTSVLKEVLHFCIGAMLVNAKTAQQDRIRYQTLENGLYDLQTQALVAHTAEIFTTNRLPYQYDPKANCPRFLQYLDEVFLSNKEVISFIQEAVGYAFHKAVPKPAIFFLLGNGSNGKSVFINLLSELIGEQNACTVSLNGLDREYYLLNLLDKMINISSETPRKKNFNTDVVKAVVGGDWVTGRDPYKRPMKFRPFAKHYLAMNDIPAIDDNSEGMWRRIYLIEFPRTFKEEEMDVNLSEKLSAELSGIFNWALEGYQRLKEKGFVFTKSRSLTDSKKKFREKVDSLSAFLAEGIEEFPDESVRFKRVYDSYQEFCRDEGYKDVKQKPELKAALEKANFKVDRSSKDSNQVHVFGISLITE